MKVGKFMRKFRKQFRYGEKGFTLIELLIVVAILGVLAALIIPNVSTFMKSGKIGAARAEKSTLQVAVDGMMADAQTTALGAAVAGWDGSAATVTHTTSGITYDAADYFRRAVDGTYNVAADGTVTCATYPGLVAADIAKVNT